jgi:aldose sugar dehydrogenase
LVLPFAITVAIGRRCIPLRGIRRLAPWRAGASPPLAHHVTTNDSTQRWFRSNSQILRARLRRRRGLDGRNPMTRQILLSLLPILCLVPTDVGGQSLVINPQGLEFHSEDHERVLPGGGRAVHAYRLEWWGRGPDLQSWAFPLGSVEIHASAAAPIGDGAYRIVFAGLPVPIGLKCVVTITARGPDGDSSRSDPSGVFVVTGGVVQNTSLAAASLAASARGPVPDGSAAAGQPHQRERSVSSTVDGIRFSIESVATGLQAPSDLAAAPDRRLFVTEAAGRVRVVEAGSLRADPALSLTGVHSAVGGGLSSIALHPQFGRNRFVYLAYAFVDPRDGPTARLVRYREVENTLGEPAVLLDRIPVEVDSPGLRLRFGADARLYISVPDVRPSIAADLAELGGKVLRLNDDGTVPEDNPLWSAVWSSDVRDPTVLAPHPLTGEIWKVQEVASKHVALGRLEVNSTRGATIPHGGGGPGRTPAGMLVDLAEPLDAAFYAGGAFPGFRNDLFIAAGAGRHLRRVGFDPGDSRSVARDERLLEEVFGRLGAVAVGADGTIYIATGNRRSGAADPPHDRILRLIPIH